MKKKIAIFLVFVSLLGLIAPAAMAAASPAIDVRIVGTPSTVNGKPSLVVKWNIIAKNTLIQLRGSSGLRLAYDNTVLQLMRYNGTGADYALTETLTAMPEAYLLGEYDNADINVYASRSANSATGYVAIELGHPTIGLSCTAGVETTLASICFAFRSGKSFEDLVEGSIRLMTINEMEGLYQPAALNVMLASGATNNVEHVFRSRSAADSLASPSFAFAALILGDVTGDGKIDIGDVNMLYLFVRGRVALTEEQKLAADVNKDSKVDIGDVNLLYLFVRGRVPAL